MSPYKDPAMEREYDRRKKARYRAENRGGINEKERLYREAHRSERVKRATTWWAAHPDKARAKAARYKDENPDKARETNARYQAAHPDKNREKQTRWRLAHPDEKRAMMAARRAKTHGVTTELVTARNVFERDNWICYLCGQPVDKTTRYPDRLSASIDHVIPLARGGSHTAANLHCTHLYCNHKKHAKLIEPSPTAPDCLDQHGWPSDTPTP